MHKKEKQRRQGAVFWLCDVRCRQYKTFGQVSAGPTILCRASATHVNSFASIRLDAEGFDPAESSYKGLLTLSGYVLLS